MTWSIHHVSLATHDLDQAAHFFGALIGLGAARAPDARTRFIGRDGRGLRLHRPDAALARSGAALLGPMGARYVALEVASLDAVVARLDQAGLAYALALPEEFAQPAIYTLDPALNLLVLLQAGDAAPSTRPAWHIHHVNLQAEKVREAVAFYTGVIGLKEGRWRAAAQRGDFSIDPAQLAVLTTADDNSGLHIIRPDPGFAFRNRFAHNPSIGGHPAFCVPDVQAVKARLEAACVLVSDAGVYAMAGIHQIYVLDPAANMIEVNQNV
ncbi:MAG: VOC family protein [Alphaproteobacteria bacterium]|nr:VOC family protein [Alphaproteobacteria bacterium]